MARTRAADYDAKRNTILRRAATAVAQSQATHCASMAEIAQKCKVSKALLYHYCDNKEALIFDILHTHLTEINEATEKAFDSSLLPKDNLRKLVHVVFDLYRSRDDEHRVQLTALPNLPEQQRETIRDIERNIVHRFSRVISQIHPAMSKDTSVIAPITLSLFGMLNWACMWFRSNGSLSREAYADMVIDIFLGGIGSLR